MQTLFLAALGLLERFFRDTSEAVKGIRGSNLSVSASTAKWFQRTDSEGTVTLDLGGHAFRSLACRRIWAETAASSRENWKDWLYKQRSCNERTKV
jgi:hypothetical protein